MDPDGFDEARRRDVFLRMVAVQAGHERERRIATMTPLEIAESDLAATIQFGQTYEAGETPFPVTEANTRAMASLIEERRAQLDHLRGSA